MDKNDAAEGDSVNQIKNAFDKMLRSPGRPYAEYTLTHWEEPDGIKWARFVAKDGYVSVTPETIYAMLQGFFPIGYEEGEITLDIPVKSLLDYWKSLGGEYGVDK